MGGEMEKAIVTLDKGSICSAWNYSGQRLAAASVDGTLAIYDPSDPASSNFTCTSRFKVAETSILKIVWVPPEFGDAVACISSDGILTLWEEVVKGLVDGMGCEWDDTSYYWERWGGQIVAI